jgi:hypothetical protein
MKPLLKGLWSEKMSSLRTKWVLIAAIEERRELVQQLWFYGHEALASEQYEELRLLRARLREVEDADTRLNHSGTDGDKAAE